MVKLQEIWEQTLPGEEGNVEQIEEYTHYFYVDIFDPDEVGTGKMYTDQTDKFPFKSSNGNQYVLVLHNYDSNAILAEPLKTIQ
eukprot:15366182-Ditylum_brightwellii.AAC.1